MRDIKCADCDNHRNEWCEKVIDSPYPDMLRDCQYFCEKRDLVEVVRCKDCKHYQAQDPTRPTTCAVGLDDNYAEEFCSRGERREHE